MTRPPKDSYESALSGALSYHLLLLLVGTAQLLRYSESDLVRQSFDVSQRALVTFSVAFALRLTIRIVGRGADRKWILIGADVAVFLLILIGYAAITVPSDPSGAAALGIIYYAIVGIPIVIATSALSVLATTSLVAHRILLVVLVVDVLLVLALGAMQVRLPQWG